MYLVHEHFATLATRSRLNLSDHHGHGAVCTTNTASFSVSIVGCLFSSIEVSDYQFGISGPAGLSRTSRSSPRGAAEQSRGITSV